MAKWPVLSQPMKVYKKWSCEINTSWHVTNPYKSFWKKNGNLVWRKWLRSQNDYFEAHGYPAENHEKKINGVSNKAYVHESNNGQTSAGPITASIQCGNCGMRNHTSSSRMRVIYHNWSATKQRPHPQSVAEISHHSVLLKPHYKWRTHARSMHSTSGVCICCVASNGTNLYGMMMYGG